MRPFRKRFISKRFVFWNTLLHSHLLHFENSVCGKGGEDIAIDYDGDRRLFLEFNRFMGSLLYTLLYTPIRLKPNYTSLVCTVVLGLICTSDATCVD